MASDTFLIIDKALEGRRSEVGTPEKISFHPAQLKYLEGIFGRVVMQPSSTQAEMNHYFGQQSVIEFIRGRTKL